MEPVSELTALLAELRTAERLPWADAAAAMAAEHRALGLARLAGPEGQRLVTAIFEETERLFTAAEQNGDRPEEDVGSDRRIALPSAGG